MRTFESAEPTYTNTAPIQCRDLWKIFGPDEATVLTTARREQLGKADVFARFGCVIAVKNASFSVRKGEIFCVMGLSGSGKSTLIRHINRLIEPTAGQVFIHGVDIGKLTREQLRKLRAERMGMVFQNVALLPYRTVLDNVAFGLEVRGGAKEKRLKAARHALEIVQLSGWEQRYTRELSGGMQQRVGLARALAANPDILLMDEPFSALDPLIRRQLQRQFLQLSQELQKTTVFITHDLDEAIRLGDRIAVMKDGILVQIGTPEEIVTNPADEYVADFVSGISRLHVVYAHSVMFPIDQYKALGLKLELAELPKVAAEADLNQLVEVMGETDAPRLAVVEGGEVVGIVTRRSLLRGIQGRSIADLAPD
jgi:glycine betaine/proline transport system ATP-binding protein